jgi:hypothetical protein
MALTPFIAKAATGKVNKTTKVAIEVGGRKVRAEIYGEPTDTDFESKVDAAARDIEQDLKERGLLKKPAPAQQSQSPAQKLAVSSGENPILGGTIFDPSRKPQTPAKPAKKPTRKEEADQAARDVLKTKSGPEFRQAVKNLGDAINRAALADAVFTNEGDPSLVGDEGIGSVAKPLGSRVRIDPRTGQPEKDIFGQPIVEGTSISQAFKGSSKGLGRMVLGGLDVVSPVLQNIPKQDREQAKQAVGAFMLNLAGIDETYSGTTTGIAMGYGLGAASGPIAKAVAKAYQGIKRVVKGIPEGFKSEDWGQQLGRMLATEQGRTALKELAPSAAKEIDEVAVAQKSFSTAKAPVDESLPGISARTGQPPASKPIPGSSPELQGPMTPPILSVDDLIPPKAAPTSQPIPGASPDIVGLAKQLTKRDPLPGTNPATIFEAGREAVETGRINPNEVVRRVKESGVTNLAEDEIGATIYRLRQIRNRQSEIEAATSAGDPLATITKNREWADLEDEAESILTAGDIIGNQWHRTGMALQVAIKKDMSLGTLMRRARSFADAPLKPGVEAQLQEISRKYEEAMRQLDKAKKEYFDDVLRVPRPEEPPRFMAKSRAQARSTASAYFQNQKMNPAGGVGKNRQRGAVSYTVSDDEMRAKSAVRKLAREIVTDGAQTLDEVLDGIRREIGVDVKDEDLLAFLHEPYSKYRLEADTARIKANQVFRELQRAAAFRASSKIEKAKTIAIQGANGIGRSLTLGFDFSAPFIQGRKFLYTNPRGWAKAFRPMFEATFQTARGNTDYALSRVAKIESDPAYARAKAAGLQLTLPNAGFTQQEEIFSGNIRAYLEMLAANKPKARIAKLVADIIGASEDAYTVFLNEVRWNTFKDMMKVAPDNPEYLRDVAQLLNVISGRGTGQFAQSLSNPIFGNLLTAPRYTVSQIQYGIGVPLWNAKTLKGFRQAAKVYGVQASVVPSLMALAAMHGWKVDWDLRSSNVGKISKDGVTIDLFGKDAQFMRLAMQSARGRYNKKGEFSEASATGVAENLGRYLTGKVAPGPRMLMTERFGVYDDGQTRPAESKDRAAYFMPVWVSDMFNDAEKFQGDKRKQALATLSNIFGLEVKPEELPETRMPAGFGVIGD